MRRLATRSVIWKKKDYTWINMGCLMTKPTNWHVFTARMKKAWVLSYPLRGQRRLIRLGGCPGWSESLLGAHSLYWFCHEAGQLCLSQRYYFTRQQNLFISYTIDIPPYLVDKASIYHCSNGCFSSTSAFLWLCSILVLFPSLWKALLAVCLCVHVCGFTFYQIYSCCFEGYHVRCWCWRHLLF